MAQDQPSYKELAQQLRQPNGALGTQVAEHMELWNAPLIDLSFEALFCKASERLLEIGFGNGSHIPRWRTQVADLHYSGIDYSATMVELARANNRSALEAGELQLQEGNLMELPFQEASFDRIVTINTVYFWPDTLAGLKELYRVLQPGGRLVIGLRPKFAVKDLPTVQHGFQLFEAEELETKLMEAGFENTGYFLNEEVVRKVDEKEHLMFGLAVAAHRPA